MATPSPSRWGLPCTFCPALPVVQVELGVDLVCPPAWPFQSFCAQALVTPESVPHVDDEDTLPARCFSAVATCEITVRTVSFVCGSLASRAFSFQHPALVFLAPAVRHDPPAPPIRQPAAAQADRPASSNMLPLTPLSRPLRSPKELLHPLARNILPALRALPAVDFARCRRPCGKCYGLCLRRIHLGERKGHGDHECYNCLKAHAD